MFLVVKSNTIKLYNGTNHYQEPLETFLLAEPEAPFTSTSDVDYFPGLMHSAVVAGIPVALELTDSTYDTYIAKTALCGEAAITTSPITTPTVEEVKQGLVQEAIYHTNHLLNELTAKYSKVEQALWVTLLVEAESYLASDGVTIAPNLSQQITARLSHSNLTPIEEKEYTLEYAKVIVTKAHATAQSINAIVGTRGRVLDYIEALAPRRDESTELFLLRLSATPITTLFKVPS